MARMQKTIRIFKSHAEAEAADIEYYRSLTPQERLEILCELVARYDEGFDESERRLQRVGRITSLEEC